MVNFQSLAVVFVIFQTGNRANGGVESITQVISRLRRVKPIVITQMETPVNDQWRASGAEVQVWPELEAENEGARQWEATNKLRHLLAVGRGNERMYRLVRGRTACVVHCNDTRALWHTALGARMGGAAVVSNIRGTNLVDKAKGWKGRLASLLTTRYLVLSQEMRTLYASWLGRSEAGSEQNRSEQNRQVRYIYSIVDFENMYPVEKEERRRLRRQRGIDSDEVALGYVGSFWETKGQLRFIEEAGPLLKRHLPEAHIYFLGDFAPERNPYARRCLRAVKRLELSDVFSFVGYTPAISDWYRALDLMTIASRREGMARAMIESLACGTPVVSFGVCSAREILEEHDCGRVVPQGAYAALVAQVAELIENPSLRERFGSNGRQTAQRLFAPGPIVAQYEELYYDLARRS